MEVCNDHVEPESSTTYAFSTKSELGMHMRLLHPSNTSSLNDKIAHAPAKQFLLDETPSLDLCPLCLFVEKSTMDAEEDKAAEEEPAPLGDNKKSSDKREARVTFADTIPPPPDDPDSGSDHGPENPPSTAFGLELHVAAHLQYLMALSLRLMATLGYDSDEDIEDDGSGSTDSATGSISPREEGIKPEEWLDEESTRPYLSDSELRLLEQTRSEEEEDKILLSPNVENWNRVKSSLVKPTIDDLTQMVSEVEASTHRADELERVTGDHRLLTDLLEYAKNTLSYR